MKTVNKPFFDCRLYSGQFRYLKAVKKYSSGMCSVGFFRHLIKRVIFPEAFREPLNTSVNISDHSIRKD